MIRSPLGLRINPDPSRSPKDQIREAAAMGAKGVILDAAGVLAPDRLGETGRRDLAHTLRSVQVPLIALNLPTRRAFDSFDDLDVRLARADRAFAMAYELGARLVVAQVGNVPPEDDPRRPAFLHALTELGKRAEHRGVRLGVEVADPGPSLGEVVQAIDHPGLGVSFDPSPVLRSGHDPASIVVALGALIIHAYTGAAAASPRSRTLDVAAYLGSLEEVGYQGFLTVWPDPARDPATEFRAVRGRLGLD